MDLAKSLPIFLSLAPTQSNPQTGAYSKAGVPECADRLILMSPSIRRRDPSPRRLRHLATRHIGSLSATPCLSQ